MIFFLKQNWKSHKNSQVDKQIFSVLYFTFLLIPDSKHSEYEGAEGGSEEAPPVVPHSKKC